MNDLDADEFAAAIRDSAENPIQALATALSYYHSEWSPESRETLDYAAGLIFGIPEVAAWCLADMEGDLQKTLGADWYLAGTPELHEHTRQEVDRLREMALTVEDHDMVARIDAWVLK